MKSSTVLAFGADNGTSAVNEERDVLLRAIPLHVVRYALTTVPFFRFDNLRRFCPNLHSYNEFVSTDEYLGSLEITFKGSKERLNRLTHLDFLLFNTMNRAPLLAIEIDGTSFHAPGTTQANRDTMKDHVMEKIHIPLLRIKTNESGERARIETALLSAVNV